VRNEQSHFNDYNPKNSLPKEITENLRPQGNWYYPNTKEWLRPDLNHPEPIPPRWDYGTPDGKTYRKFPDGSFEIK
jgi:hypothetical protein